MPPKDPIQIGLTKKRPAVPDDDLEDEIDNTVPPLSDSVMEALESLVPSDESQDFFGEELDRDQDPDYVQPEQEPQAGPSRLRGRGKALLKQPALNLVTTATATATGHMFASF